MHKPHRVGGWLTKLKYRPACDREHAEKHTRGMARHDRIPKEGFFVLTTHLSFFLFWAGWIHDIYFSAPTCTWPVYEGVTHRTVRRSRAFVRGWIEEEEEESVAVKINIYVRDGGRYLPTRRWKIVAFSMYCNDYITLQQVANN